MGYDKHSPREQAQGDRAFLPIVEADILETVFLSD
jgi:hypothetical protein